MSVQGSLGLIDGVELISELKYCFCYDFRGVICLINFTAVVALLPGPLVSV